MAAGLDEDQDEVRSERVPPLPGEAAQPLVPFVPIACPGCGSLRPNTYGRGRNGEHHFGERLRYHSCRQCSREFQSLEFDAPTLRRDPLELQRLQHVLFVAFRCPRCNSDKPRTHRQRGRIRLHDCQSCGCQFRSLQLTAAELTPAMLVDLR